jgi:hypothetical protein
VETVEKLMAARHETYQRALAENFRDTADVERWREANRDYVAARRALKATLKASTGSTGGLRRTQAA